MLDLTQEKINSLIETGDLHNICLAFQLAKSKGENSYKKVIFHAKSKISSLVNPLKDIHKTDLTKQEKHFIDSAVNITTGLEKENEALYPWSKLLQLPFANDKAWGDLDWGNYYHPIQLLFRYSTLEVCLLKKNFKGLPANIGMLSQLENILLWNLKIEEIPENFGQLKSLKRVF